MSPTLSRPHVHHATSADVAFIPSPVANATAQRSPVPSYEQALSGEDIRYAPIIGEVEISEKPKDADYRDGERTEQNGDFIPQEPNQKAIAAGRPALGRRARTDELTVDSLRDVLSLRRSTTMGTQDRKSVV